MMDYVLVKDFEVDVSDDEKRMTMKMHHLTV